MNKKINNKIRSDLEGFEDLLDLVEKKRRFGGYQREEKIGKEYDVLSFLEQEKVRLEKIYSFFNSKAKILNEFSQLPPILNISESEIKNREDKLLELIMEDASIFSRNIEIIYKQFFPTN